VFFVVSEIYVVDSGSTDRTVEIAKSYGAQVLTHPFINQATQFNWALANVNSAADWILRIDADERLSEELQQAVRDRLPNVGSEVSGILIPRRVRFLGRDIRHGDTYPVWLLRLWRKGLGRSEDTWMDEHIVLSAGNFAKFRGDLIHDIPKNLSDWTQKHDAYAARMCKSILSAGSNEGAPLASRQATVKRSLNKHLYLRLPAFHRAFLYWFYRYFFRLGFLDGKQGLIYHFLQAFWYRFLIDAKLFELRRRAAVGSEPGHGEIVPLPRDSEDAE